MARIAKQYESPDNGPLIEFYLGRLDGMKKNQRYTLPVSVNGYSYTAVFGEKNILPKSVVEVIKNAKSAVMAGGRDVDSARGGDGRPASELLSRQGGVEYIPDYDVVIHKEA